MEASNRKLSVTTEPAAGPSDGHQVLEDLHVRGLLADGRAHIISVAAVRLGIGERWFDRKEMVWELTEQKIDRRLGPSDFFARLDDDHFLIVSPALSVSQAKLVAVWVMQDVLRHFLGESRTPDILIKIVNSYDDGELICRSLSEHEIEAITGGTDQSVADERPPISADTSELTTFDGRRLWFSTRVDPIIDLSRFLIAGHRVDPKIEFEDSRLPLNSSERRQLLPRDMEAIDLANLRRGLRRLSEGESVAARPSLIITVSFLSLSNTRARTALLSEANRSRALMTKAVIWEVTDYEEGLPADRLSQAAALLKPFCRSVFLRQTGSKTGMQSLKSMGFSGLVVRTPAELTLEDDVAIWLLNAARLVQGRAPTLIASDLASHSLLPLAAAAGFSHATLRVSAGTSHVGRQQT